MARRPYLRPGQPLRARLDPSDVARFMARVVVDVVGPGWRGDPCWLWTGGTDAKGYGQFKLAGQARWVHRVAWELFHTRALPHGHDVDHRCHCRACVNPRHLRSVPRLVNSTRNQPPSRPEPCDVPF